MEKAFRVVGKFWFPVTCIIFGIIFLIKGSGQSSEYMIASAAVLLIGLLSLLFLVDMIKKKVLLIFTFLFLGASACFAYLNYKSIDGTMKLMAEKKLVKAQVIQGLKDMRTAQLAYMEANGVYTENLDELTQFVKSGTIPVLKKIGTIPDSIGTEEMAREAGLIIKMPAGMTDEQVLAKGLIVRDTVQISVMQSKFESEIALKKRKFPFDLSKMIYVPRDGAKWTVKTGKLTTGGVEKPFLLIQDPVTKTDEATGGPFYGGAAMAVGSTEEAHTNGNWKED
jgi:hypothetical protein